MRMDMRKLEKAKNTNLWIMVIATIANLLMVLAMALVMHKIKNK